MKKLLRTLILIGTLTFFISGLVFVFGQAVCLLIGRPEMVIQIKSTVSKVAFPSISITGLLCFIYHYFINKAMKGGD